MSLGILLKIYNTLPIKQILYQPLSQELNILKMRSSPYFVNKVQYGEGMKTKLA